jgi:hypothetical protein
MPTLAFRSRVKSKGQIVRLWALFCVECDLICTFVRVWPPIPGLPVRLCGPLAGGVPTARLGAIVSNLEDHVIGTSHSERIRC